MLFGCWDAGGGQCEARAKVRPAQGQSCELNVLHSVWHVAGEQTSVGPLPQPAPCAWRGAGPSGKRRGGTEWTRKSRSAPTQAMTCPETSLELSGFALKIGTTVAGLCIFKSVLRT